MLKLVLFLTGLVGVIVGAPQNVDVMEYSPDLVLWDTSLYEDTLTAAQNVTRTLLDGRIVGGENADIADYQYMASLQFAGSHRCGAAIISTTWILSAAHCLVSGAAVSQYTIRAGTSTRNSGGVTYGISRILIHASYSNLDYDIIALQTTGSIVAGTNSRAAPLPSASSGPSAGLTATITGWGITSEVGSLSTILQAVQVPTISQASCQTFYGSSLTTTMFCAGFVGVGGKDACQGDSGGPLNINGVLFGLVSWGNGCARPNAPGVYTNLPFLRSWITAATGL